MSSKEKARRSLPQAFKQRWLDLRSQVRQALLALLSPGNFNSVCKKHCDRALCLPVKILCMLLCIPCWNPDNSNVSCLPLQGIASCLRHTRLQLIAHSLLRWCSICIMQDWTQALADDCYLISFSLCPFPGTQGLSLGIVCKVCFWVICRWLRRRCQCTPLMSIFRAWMHAMQSRHGPKW